MPIIRISDQNWRRMQAWAVPLEDTADSALSKVLDAAEGRIEPAVLRDACARPPKSRWTEELESWLQARRDVKLEKSGKTMSTYRMEGAKSRLRGGRAPGLFVTRSGLLYLPPLGGEAYAAADVQGRVVQEDMGDPPVGWKYYPRFTVRTEEDLEYAKGLIGAALQYARSGGTRT